MSTKVMLEVLEKAADNSEARDKFLLGVVERGSASLEGLGLTQEERAAIISGDVQFIESRIGRKLEKKLIDEVMIPLLSRERY
ncbi:hypothetical protein ES705_46421 [subsurface metagenome]